VIDAAPYAVGIDLGTTNSVVSVLEAGEPTVIPNAEGARTTPSVVGFSKAGEVLVGEVAKRQAITNPDRTIRSVKRQMGTSWTIDIDGKKYTPQEISARILGKLKRDAEARAGRESRRLMCERLALLTQREREVLEHVVAGKMNREIAELLDISVKTVEAHRAKIMEKLEVNSVAELVQARLAAGAAANDAA